MTIFSWERLRTQIIYSSKGTQNLSTCWIPASLGTYFYWKYESAFLGMRILEIYFDSYKESGISMIEKLGIWSKKKNYEVNL